MDKLSRMKELIALLDEASRAYYAEDRELMPNIEYDRLYDELAALEEAEGVILAGSPTRKVGYELLSSLQKHEHRYPMLSLDKTKDVAKLESFLGGREGVLMLKLDGLSVSLEYENGALALAATRGNGVIGEIITHNALTFVNLPRQVSFKGRLCVRGEALISYAEFERINETIEDGEKYKNPRNLTSGTVRQLNSEICAGRRVSFFAFSLAEAEGMSFSLKSEALEFLKGLGFDTAAYRVVNSSSVAEAVSAFQNGIETGYAADGLVLSYNETAFSASLGATSKFPKDSLAFKWEDETAETTLLSVEWNTSRTGLINPVAVFEPAELLGTSVSRASLHNLSIVEELELGIGDRLLIYKANMIIPQIAENLSRSGGLQVPQNCPVCGFGAEIQADNGVKTLICPNPGCEAQLVRSLTHFSARDAMNIEGLSGQTIERFVRLGLLKSPADIYRLPLRTAEIRELDGFGERSCERLMTAIEKSRFRELPNFIYALGIRHVGLSTAKLVCESFKHSLPDIRLAVETRFVQIDGLGEKTAYELVTYFGNEKNSAALDDLLSFVEFEAPPEKGLALAGMVFVITGSLAQFASRDELAAKIEVMGGKTASSVSAKTSYLINNDAASTSAKNKKAAELGVPVITEKELTERFMAH